MRNLKVNIAKSHKEAEKYDIEQARKMTPEERLRALTTLRERYYGKDNPDIRESEVVRKRSLK